MKTRRPAARHGAGWLRFLGYGGSVLLVLAAVAVLLLPLLGQGGDAGAAAGARSAGPSQNAAPQPLGSPGFTTGPSAADPQRPPARSTTPQGDPLGQGDPLNPGGDGGEGGGGGGQGDPLAPRGGTTPDYCPRGLGAVRYGMTGLEVTVQFSGAAFVQVVVHLVGLRSLEQTTQVQARRPHTFVFETVTPDQVERVQVKSVGATIPQSCDLRLN
ncbi:hypothetical protein [Thermomonospora curvata]|uniref:Uncharacterized protein n=1 Tax=Thermomonospora curvata (strain ATCC 19995 / DSM 43183 / JCM 3096 / KCTC 9072 / NBRC 15933 / NCIMB 10081 / Henssen B9) TaxID=471852 RepID=D1AET7_THECD|nr:hypothetical protein [Thermomonospora curvata]ACY97662.1 hypothetical protein Tcur_2096 [Thermomonospora curvata DSM 43183]